MRGIETCFENVEEMAKAGISYLAFDPMNLSYESLLRTTTIVCF